MTRGFRVKTSRRFGDVMREVQTDIAAATTQTMQEISNALKQDLRGQVSAAGLGDKVANTWRSRRYPTSGTSVEAAAFVWSKAPKIIDAFDRGPLIHAVNGRKYLAIPTDNVPRTTKGRDHGRRMSPIEVEQRFGQDLEFARARAGRMLLYLNMTATDAGGFRRLSTRQLDKLWRKGKSPGRLVQVVMFVLVPSAQMPKRLGVDKAANYWADQVKTILDRRLSGS